MKVCNGCGVEKKESQYYNQKATCKQCISGKYFANRDRILADRATWYVANTELSSIRTKGWYRANTAKAIALAGKWRKENPEKAKEHDELWRKANPDKIRSKGLRYKYGIDLQDYESMLDDQGGVCKICKTTTENLVVDHCHATGAVRGILCNGCNAALGFMHDSPDRLIAAAEYLSQGQVNAEFQFGIVLRASDARHGYV